jgi:hypothetical protein
MLTLFAIDVLLAATGSWGEILHQRLSVADEWLVTIALSLFCANIPLSLGTRMLMGVGRSRLAVILLLSSSLFGLGSTILLSLLNVEPIAYSISAYSGIAFAALLSTVIAFRVLRVELGVSPRSLRPTPLSHVRADLAGSEGMFLVMIALPLTLESSRIILVHESTNIALSEYALAAQLYAMIWGILSTSSGSLWRSFVQLRDASGDATKLWRRSTIFLGAAGFAGALGLVAFGPIVAGLLSNRQINPSRTLFIGLGILLIAQALHLAGGVMFTRPVELRRQGALVSVMAFVAIGASMAVAPLAAGTGIAFVVASAVLLFQFVPDLILVRRQQVGQRA